MKINSLEIEKFRSIKESKIKMYDVMAVVGENNAGKTAVLRAINSIFNFEDERKYFETKKHQYLKRTVTKITIELIDIPKDNKFFSKYIYEDKLKLIWSYSYSDNRRSLRVIKGTEEMKISNLNLFFDEIKKIMIYVYIPSSRTDFDISWNDESIFKKLIVSYLEKYTQNRDTISSSIKASSKKIHDNVLTKLEKDMGYLYMQDNDLKFNIDFKNILDYNAILNFLEISIEDDDINYSLKEWGSGTKSLAIIALYRAYALIQKIDIILGIEEPEINLHPQAQKRFIHSLRRSMSNQEVQTIFTTHSTVLVDELKHENILLVKRKKVINRNFISVINQISDNFFKKNKIKERALYNFFSLRNSEFLFSNCVIICESSNDVMIMKEILKPLIKKKFLEISFIDLNGANNITYPYFLLKDLGIPFYIIVDFDFFYDYKNEEIDLSRDKNYMPVYKKNTTSKPPQKIILDDIFGNKITELNSIKGYRDFFDKIKSKNIYSMKYNLEIDLMNSKKALDKYYEILNVSQDNRNKRFLLEKNGNAIKKREHLFNVVDSLERKELPESYKKIAKDISEKINKL